MHAHLGAAHHQGIPHVIARVSHVHQANVPRRAEALPDGQEVGQNLGRMEFIGQAVPDRHAGIPPQILDDLLAVAAVFDAVKHAAQHPGGVRQAFLLAQLAPGGIQVGALHAQIVGGDLEGAAGAGAGLFKDQGDVFPFEEAMGNAGLLLGLQFRRQIQQPFDFGRGEIEQLQKFLLLQLKHGGSAS